MASPLRSVRSVGRRLVRVSANLHLPSTLRPREVLTLLTLKLVALGVLFGFDPNLGQDLGFVAWVRNFLAQGRYAVAGLLIAMNILCAAALLACGLLSHAWLRGLWVSAIGVLFCFNFAYFRITHDQLDYVMLTVLLRELADAPNAARTYHGAVLASAALVAPSTLVLAYLPRRFPVRLPASFSLLPALAAVLVVTLFYRTGGLPSFPSPFTVAGNLSLVALTAPYYGDRAPLAYEGKVSPRIRRIVVIVDESVRGDLLGVNNPEHATTPYLARESRLITSASQARSPTAVPRPGWRFEAVYVQIRFPTMTRSA